MYKRVPRFLLEHSSSTVRLGLHTYPCRWCSRVQIQRGWSTHLLLHRRLQHAKTSTNIFHVGCPLRRCLQVNLWKQPVAKSTMSNKVKDLQLSVKNQMIKETLNLRLITISYAVFTFWMVKISEKTGIGYRRLLGTSASFSISRLIKLLSAQKTQFADEIIACLWFLINVPPEKTSKFCKIYRQFLYKKNASCTWPIWA